VGSHRRLRAALPFTGWELPIRIDLVLEPRHEAAPGRLGDLASVVAGGAREPADAGHLTTDDGIA